MVMPASGGAPEGRDGRGSPGRAVASRVRRPARRRAPVAEERPVTDVAAWLRGLGLGRYEAAFRENDVGADVLPELTADDLREIGVASVGDRRRLLAAIAALRGPAPSSKTPADEPPPAQAAPTATAPPGDPGSDRGA